MGTGGDALSYVSAFGASGVASYSDLSVTNNSAIAGLGYGGAGQGGQGGSGGEGGMGGAANGSINVAGGLSIGMEESTSVGAGVGVSFGGFGGDGGDGGAGGEGIGGAGQGG